MLRVIPGYHFDKQSSIMSHGRVPQRYDLVVSKLSAARRRALGWDGDATSR